MKSYDKKRSPGSYPAMRFTQIEPIIECDGNKKSFSPCAGKVSCSEAFKLVNFFDDDDKFVNKVARNIKVTDAFRPHLEREIKVWRSHGPGAHFEWRDRLHANIQWWGERLECNEETPRLPTVVFAGGTALAALTAACMGRAFWPVPMVGLVATALAIGSNRCLNQKRQKYRELMAEWESEACGYFKWRQEVDGHPDRLRGVKGRAPVEDDPA